MGSPSAFCAVWVWSVCGYTIPLYFQLLGVVATVCSELQHFLEIVLPGRSCPAQDYTPPEGSSRPKPGH